MAKTTVGLPGGRGAAVLKSYHARIGPNVDEPRVLGGTPGNPFGVVALRDNDDLTTGRVQATGINTFTGTPGVGDTVKITIGGVLVQTIVGAGPPSLTAIAAQQVAAINAKPELQGKVRAVNSAGVVTLIHGGGIGGNSVTVTVATTTSVSLVQTLSGLTSGKLTGGLGPVRALKNFSFTFRRATGAGQANVQQFFENRYYLVDAAMAAALVAAGQPIA